MQFSLGQRLNRLVANLPSGEQIQDRIIRDRRLTAALTGLALGVGAALIGLLLALGGPILALAAMVGIAVALYVLTDLMAALYVLIAITILLPFGTVPVKIALVPTFIDAALGAFLMVYLFQWMTGKRSGMGIKVVPAHALLGLFIAFMIFSFVAGMAHASPTSSVLRKFVELVLSLGMGIVITDVARDEETIRRIVLAFLIVAGVQAIIGLGLYVINDATAERILNALGRFGYPVGGVIRYINDDPTMAERAIGTWVDPNNYGGFLMMMAALAGVQTLSPRPVLRYRWLTAAIFLLLALDIWCTQSRGALIALGAVMVFVAALRYRWVLVAMILAGALILLLPFTQTYIDRFVEGLTGQDLSTQMRLGEYKDALTLVGRYPIIGVGFSGTPDRDIYLGVSMLYLKIAGGMGITGLILFFVVIGEVYRYGLARWRRMKANPGLLNLWMGFAGGVVGALVSGIFDHYYFNMDFIGSSLLLWLFIGLSLACASLAPEKAVTKIGTTITA